MDFVLFLGVDPACFWKFQFHIAGAGWYIKWRVSVGLIDAFIWIRVVDIGLLFIWGNRPFDTPTKVGGSFLYCAYWDLCFSFQRI
ncbi:MAG: hypothetical protein ACMUEM_01365 [Flavobacteriales bacterium AspAUS03]